ncbi:MAG TPA: 2-phosphosulfolactate phosphatase [Bacteroidales bacterium]|nr:2-phosphosulfolactate phosphatase [Bacteroidales bacterium]HPT11867.1 2-phosphosulfolactate phosphatase [Bacteroidales bacterium]
MQKKVLEVCLSPAMYSKHADSEIVVVVIDILRATSAICTALANGASEIIPVDTVEEARKRKMEGSLVAAERDGFVLDFADFGNSPFNFTPERVKNKSIVYSTTNGTGIINMSSECNKVLIGSYLNFSALASWLINQERDVLIFCAGWKERISLEDTICAGAFATKLINSGEFTTICDSAIASMDLWDMAKDDLNGYIEKAAQRSRLRDKGLDDCIEFCHTFDFTDVIPVLKDGKLIPLSELRY